MIKSSVVDYGFSRLRRHGLRGGGATETTNCALGEALVCKPVGVTTKCAFGGRGFATVAVTTGVEAITGVRATTGGVLSASVVTVVTAGLVATVSPGFVNTVMTPGGDVTLFTATGRLLRNRTWAAAGPATATTSAQYNNPRRALNTLNPPPNTTVSTIMLNSNTLRAQIIGFG